VIELNRSGKEKRARRITTRPEPTIIGNCDVLELHCRQKAPNVQPSNRGMLLVARSQHQIYQQLIHSFEKHDLNNLWVKGVQHAKPCKVFRMVAVCNSAMPVIALRQPRFYRKK
jgi:hypothetical protein